MEHYRALRNTSAGAWGRLQCGKLLVQLQSVRTMTGAVGLGAQPARGGTTHAAPETAGTAWNRLWRILGAASRFGPLTENAVAECLTLQTIVPNRSGLIAELDARQAVVRDYVRGVA